MSTYRPISDNDSFSLNPIKYPDLSKYIYDLNFEKDENDGIHTTHSNLDAGQNNKEKKNIEDKTSTPIENEDITEDYKDLVDSRQHYKTKHDLGNIEKQLLLPRTHSNYTNGFNIISKRPKNLAAPIKKSVVSDVDKPPPVRCRMDWNNYHRLDVIHSFIDDLEYQYPSVCTAGSIGKSLEGRDMKILKISNSDAKNTCVWMDAGIHAREWIAPATATYIANHIASNFNDLPQYMTNKDWYFLPVVNPDGYEYSHTTNRLWRKNRAYYEGHCVGVDLNRNFSYGWGLKESSDNPSSNFFRGPEPFSEPESCAVRSISVRMKARKILNKKIGIASMETSQQSLVLKYLEGPADWDNDMIKNSEINFKVYITLHSYGQVILFPFAFREELCPDYIRLLEGATTMSRAIYEASGNTYKVGISRDVMYGAAGTSNDWSYGDAGIPFCYLIELRSKKHKFKLPKQEIAGTGHEILSSVKALMEFVDNYDSPTFKGEAFKQSSTSTTSGVYAIKNLSLYLSMTSATAINIWKEERSTMDIMVEGPRASSVAGMLHERDIPFSVAVENLGLLLETEKSAAISKARRGSGTIKTTMDWQNYHTLDVIYNFMDKLVADYPYICSVSTIGNTVESRKIKMLKISNGNSSNVGVWLDGSIHPREWISTAVVTYIADKLVKTFSEQPESVTNKDWYIVPVLNPDGYEYTYTSDRMWRKNRSRHGECVGVDLNRNFSYGFGENGEEGSSEDPGNIFYRGPEPFSERETIAVKNVVTDTDANFKVFLSFHSYGEVIIFPWGYTGDPCPDYVELLEGGTAMAKAIHDVSGHTYKVGSTKDLMYYAAGTSTDWAYAVAGIPYSYMLELRGKTHRFLLPKEEIVPTAVEVMNGVMSLMDFVDRRCRATQSCICHN